MAEEKKPKAPAKPRKVAKKEEIVKPKANKPEVTPEEDLPKFKPVEKPEIEVIEPEAGKPAVVAEVPVIEELEPKEIIKDPKELIPESDLPSFEGKGIKTVIRKLNPNLADGKSKWEFVLIRDDKTHTLFKGSLERAHKWAENYCIVHKLDKKQIQIIRR